MPREPFGAREPLVRSDLSELSHSDFRLVNRTLKYLSYQDRKTMQFIAKNLFAKVSFVGLLAIGLIGGVHGQTMADVDAVVQRAIDANVTPGAGVAVVRDGKVLFTKGYGLA